MFGLVGVVKLRSLILKSFSWKVESELMFFLRDSYGIVPTNLDFSNILNYKNGGIDEWVGSI